MKSKSKPTFFTALIGLLLFGLYLFSAGSVSVVMAGFTPTPEPENTPVLPATNTPVPAATNTPVPAATNTPVPAATNTPIPAATNTPVSQSATNTPSSNSGGGTSNPTNTPEPVVNREVRANAAENAPNIPALGEGISLQLLLILNGVFVLLLFGLIFAWRAVAHAMRKNDR